MEKSERQNVSHKINEKKMILHCRTSQGGCMLGNVMTRRKDMLNLKYFKIKNYILLMKKKIW